MTGNPAHQVKIRLMASVAGRRRMRGRHRLGQPGLYHCVTRPAVQTRLAAQRPTRTTGRLRLPVRLMAAASSAAAVMLVVTAARYAASGASAIVRIVAR